MSRNDKGQFAPLDPLTYLLSNYSHDPVTNCWNWTGSVLQGGYGAFKCVAIKRGTMNASRASWIVHFGPIASTKIKVCHTCDNRRCVNPEHLFLGTTKDNMADAATKGRMSKGTDRPQAKLDEDTVLEIKSLRDAGWSYRQLGKRYGVSHSVCWLAATGRAWRHVS